MRFKHPFTNQWAVVGQVRRFNASSMRLLARKMSSRVTPLVPALLSVGHVVEEGKRHFVVLVLSHGHARG